MKKCKLASGLVLAAVLTTAVTLSSCSVFAGTDASSQSAPAAPIQEEVHTIQGTLNVVDSGLEYLILITEDGYYRFDFSQSEAELSDLVPGDSVTVTYTGNLDQEGEEITAQLISIEKVS